MKRFVFLTLLSLSNCSENDKDDKKIEERRVVGGGNFGGFIGLTTYGAGPFLVKGKYERDNFDDKEKKDGEEKDPKLIGNVGYEDIQRNQVYGGGQYRYAKRDDDDDYIEYLGYRGPKGYCIGELRQRYENNNYGYGQNQNNNNSTEFDKEINARCDKLFGFNGPTGNDEPENIVRPCALDDWQCIRKYFAANSNCKPAYGPIPDPLYLAQSTEFFPIANVTVSIPNQMVRGLSSARISEFYVNRFSGNLVLALNVTNLNESTARLYVRYRRTAKESIVLADASFINYPSVIMTAVIPKIPHLRLDLADIHPDATSSAVQYYLGPGTFNSTDPDVQSGFAALNAFLPITIRESLVFRAQLLTSIYIQQNICDFGLKIVSL